MTILAYFDNSQLAANAISQLSQNPEIKDVSYIARERIDPEMALGEPDITQGDVEVDPMNTDSFFSALLPDDQQAAEYLVDPIGPTVIGGRLLDLFQVNAQLTDSPITNLSQALKHMGFDGYAKKVADVVSNGNIVLFLTLPEKYNNDIDRLLENYQTINVDVLKENILNFE